MNILNIRIELFSVLRDLIKNIWVIFLATLMGFMSIYIATQSFYTPEYTATAMIVVNAKSSTTGAYSLYSHSVEITKVIAKVIVESTIKEKAAEKMDAEKFDAVLRASIYKETNFLTLSVTSDSPQKSYDHLMAVLEVYPEISDNVFDNVVIYTLKMPEVPMTPSNGISTIKRLLSVAIVTAFATVCVVLMSIFRDTVKDEEDFQNKLEAKLIGTIPHEKRKFRFKENKENVNKPLIIHNNSFITLGFVENYHKIAAKIEHNNRRNNSKVFAVTSVAENEGKSTTAANIAISLADRGHKVILIDMDCKKPELFNIFEKKYSDKAEFSNLMNGVLKTNEFRLRRYKQSSLYLALNAEPYEEYGDWISSGKFTKVLEVFKNQVDFIIFDTAPVNSDAVVTDLVKLADETIVVIRTDVAFASDINDTLTTLTEVGGDLTGCILNDVYPEFSFLTLAGMDESGSQYSFNYRKGGHYKYGKYGKYGRYGHYDNDNEEE